MDSADTHQGKGEGLRENLGLPDLSGNNNRTYLLGLTEDLKH